MYGFTHFTFIKNARSLFFFHNPRIELLKLFVYFVNGAMSIIVVAAFSFQSNSMARSENKNLSLCILIRIWSFKLHVSEFALNQNKRWQNKSYECIISKFSISASLFVWHGNDFLVYTLMN